MTKASKAYIALGANLNSPASTLESALETISQSKGIELVKRSSLYRSPPLDADGPDYINAVAEIKTTLTPLELLHQLQAIENAFGRERLYRNSPRTLDLDVLLYENFNSDSAELTVPHPRMHLRSFVLMPLMEIAGDMSLQQGYLSKLLEEALASGQIIHAL
ncbi:2-amino-4-hydroxy-6-hydroxymethyldihydropteridinepyrophosphokinase [Oligella ureolytica]|uniref:2-amino-4-hydroxy-6-hydroxymethyldihydropteridine pyrophosphokinase n=1 Tax=Oligella ureolytica TaxID=90244 RepID=A0A378XCI1_9BURK|nr:2-amino-4-hydroxy-6-hydroxymethyldihydropteridine diphosphokinase [Oligella ureolytica]QPT40665.1 2-amino-4-hydroxy-6-hydroxymethyldihydropteridine diphosphokinase [Oligella ureolytica]SUA52387.1 2-amino-4-hydroxy-6-hydroxymethyldihydropteridinepyrophosphokinase [Oligella ureolytica]